MTVNIPSSASTYDNTLVIEPPKTLYQIEKEAIMGRLRSLEYNVTFTAKSLGISDRTIYNKLEMYGISPSELKVRRRLIKEHNRDPHYMRQVKEMEIL